MLQNEISCLDAAFEIAEQKDLRIAFNPSPLKENIKQLPLKCVKWFFCNEIEGEALFGSGDHEIMKENFLLVDILMILKFLRDLYRHTYMHLVLSDLFLFEAMEYV